MKEIYLKALTKWGIDNQRWILIEEMGEVMQAFSHERRRRATMEDVAQELVDLQTILNSVKLHYLSDYKWKVKTKIAEERLKKRLCDN